MSKKQKSKPAAKTIKARIRRLKNMSWDSWSNIMLIATAAVAVITFVSGLTTLYVGYKSGQEKDGKAKAQDERIANLDLKRAEAERDLAAIKERLKSRSLTSEERERFKSTLGKQPGAKISVNTIANNDEANRFASQIVEILNELEYDSKGVSQSIFRVPPRGVHIITDNADNPLAVKLQRAFASIGIEAPGALRQKQSAEADDFIEILVGHKP
jgi:hypothetical protein